MDEIKRGDAAQEMIARHLNRATQDPSVDASVNNVEGSSYSLSEALRILDGNRPKASAVGKAKALDVSGFTIFSRAAEGENEFSVGASTSSSEPGSLSQLTLISGGKSLPADCDYCVNLAASTIVKYTSCPAGQTITASTNHTAPGGVATSAASGECVAEEET